MQQSDEQGQAQGRESQLKALFQKSSDFTFKSIVMGSQGINAYYFKTLVDLSTTLSYIREETSGESSGDGGDTNILKQYKENKTLSADELSRFILQGKLVLFESDGTCAVISTEHPNLSRAISSPESENPLQSAFDAFTEDIDLNIGSLRKQTVTSDLVVETSLAGSKSTRKLALIYSEQCAKPEVVRLIREKLQQNISQDVTSVGDLMALLGQPKISIMPTYLTTELPGEAIQNLKDGKVIILMDQFSFAFSFPAVVSDLWANKLDSNYPFLFQLFFRYIRFIGVAFAVTMPGLYIVLNSVNPELLRIQLAITVAKSREGVPYPSIVEILLVSLLLEMIIEASIRLPKSIGSTITMIGGILLGQAIVQAKLVSNLLIIILVASVIANFVISGYLNTIGIRIYKYVVMFTSAFFGIWGLEAAIVWVCFYFASVNTFSVPYLSFTAKGKDANE